MSKTKKTLTIVFGVFMLLVGIIHFVKPLFYFRIVPDFFPKLEIIYLSGIIEIAVGLFVFFPRLRSLGTLGILLLMIVFLPLHIADVFKEQPAVGSHLIAWIRLAFQFVFMGWAWYIHKK